MILSSDGVAEDAAQLGQCRRGIELLRVVIMPQHYRQANHAARHRADARVGRLVLLIDLTLLHLEPTP